MRDRVLVVSADLSQLMDFGVDLRGESFAPILACAIDVLARAAGSSDGSIVCLAGCETAADLRRFLMDEPNAVIVGPGKGLDPASQGILDGFGAVYFEFGTPALI